MSDLVLTPGLTVSVPRGGDYARTIPYRLTVTEVCSVVDGVACVFGVRSRAGGGPTLRHEGHIFAVLDVSRFRNVEM